jgi:hypothetical protein
VGSSTDFSVLTGGSQQVFHGLWTITLRGDAAVLRTELATRALPADAATGQTGAGRHTGDELEHFSPKLARELTANGAYTPFGGDRKVSLCG